MKRGERGLRGGLNAVGNRLLRRLIAGPQKPETIDQPHLLERRAADEAAVVELRRGERARQAGFAAGDTRDSALDQEARRHDSTPGGHPVEPGRRFVGIAVEVTRAARERVEKRRAVAAVAARQDVGRISGPEEDSLAPEVRRPSLVGPRAVRKQPAPDHRFGEPRALFARRGGGKVAQPGEALELPGEGAARPGCRKVEVPQRDRLSADAEAAGEQGFAALTVALNVVPWYCEELERLLAVLQPRQQGASGELGDDRALGSRAFAHLCPRSALMLWA
jgi:hypothetical protein